MSDDGKWLAYSGTGRNGKDTDVYVAPTDNPQQARRVTELDVFACSRRGGRRRVLAYLTAPGGVHAIVEHLALPARPARLAPAQGPPQSAWC